VAADRILRPGLGKLGGQELNYSSDVDLMFVYTEEGHAFREPPTRTQQSGKGLTNHQFFKRLIEAFVAEVTRMTPEGTLYRIDLRLRPEETPARWPVRSAATKITTRNGARPGSA